MSTPTVHWETRLFSDPTAEDAEQRPRASTSARAAYQEVLHGRAVLVDIRPAAERAAQGDVAPHLGVLVADPRELSWRFDPGHDRRVLVLCAAGRTSPEAAQVLRGLGVSRATHVAGGLQAWREAGLPTTRGRGVAA